MVLFLSPFLWLNANWPFDWSSISLVSLMQLWMRDNSKAFVFLFQINKKLSLFRFLLFSSLHLTLWLSLKPSLISLERGSKHLLNRKIFGPRSAKPKPNETGLCYKLEQRTIIFFKPPLPKNTEGARGSMACCNKVENPFKKKREVFLKVSVRCSRF